MLEPWQGEMRSGSVLSVAAVAVAPDCDDAQTAVGPYEWLIFQKAEILSDALAKHVGWVVGRGILGFRLLGFSHTDASMHPQRAACFSHLCGRAFTCQFHQATARAVECLIRTFQARACILGPSWRKAHSSERSLS